MDNNNNTCNICGKILKNKNITYEGKQVCLECLIEQERLSNLKDKILKNNIDEVIKETKVEIDNMTKRKTIIKEKKNISDISAITNSTFFPGTVNNFPNPVQQPSTSHFQFPKFEQQTIIQQEPIPKVDVVTANQEELKKQWSAEIKIPEKKKNVKEPITFTSIEEMIINFNRIQNLT